MNERPPYSFIWYNTTDGGRFVATLARGASEEMFEDFLFPKKMLVGVELPCPDNSAVPPAARVGTTIKQSKIPVRTIALKYYLKNHI
jgi:hypothetical protein